MKENSKSGGRVYYLDILRVIACIQVVVVHSCASYVVKDIGSFNFWLGNVIDGLFRVAMPLFVMISGALMLDQNYQFGTKKLIKHVKKLLIFFVFWSAVYCLISDILLKVVINHEPFDITKIMGSFFEGYYHLWYIQMLIGLYLIVPLLRLWVKDENKKYVEYFLILAVIFNHIIPEIITVANNYGNMFKPLQTVMDSNMVLKYVGGYTSYLILGWYLHNYDIKNKKAVYFLGILGSLVTVFGTYIYSVTAGKPLQLYGNLFINVMLPGVAVFVFIKSKFANSQYKYKGNKLINSISEHSLGIYAIHALIIAVLNKILEKIGFDIAIVNILLVFSLSFGSAYLATYIFRKIPFMKKFV